MAFPTSPTNGQTTTQNGQVYTYSSALGAWTLTTSTTGALSGTSVTATANITGGNLLTSGLLSVTGNVTGGNLLTSGLLSVTGNVTGGNLNAVGLSLSGNVVSAVNLISSLTAGTTISAVGNITGGNVGISTTPRYKLSIGSVTPTSTATPDTIDLGGTYSSTAGANPKLRVYWDGTNAWGIGVSSGQQDYVTTGQHVFYQSGTERMRIDGSGYFVPGATATYDLGTASLRWRNVYTSDLHLNNGIGNYTIVEGEDDLFLYNNKNGKTYKFALTEVDPATVPPKMKES